MNSGKCEDRLNLISENTLPQGNEQTPNSITNVSKDVSEKLIKNPQNGDGSMDDEIDGRDIEAFDFIDLGSASDSDVELL